MRRQDAGFDGSQQLVIVDSGFAYGVVGADLHVFRDRGPVYLLTEHEQPSSPDSTWLTAQPSRLLNARFHAVNFTGRLQEQETLASWRDKPGQRLSALWLHAPGGQGKTRLADQFASSSTAAGWKVVHGSHGLGFIWPPAGSQDMRLRDAVGLLLIVDYADRWPPSHLAWLFSNALFHHQIPTRLLLLARSAKAWPVVRSNLEDLHADTGDLVLHPLTDQADQNERKQMFRVARDCFSTHYSLDSPTEVKSPGSLHRPEFGLVLAVHIAALVAVDAHARGMRAPEEMADLSSYLLNRERKHWSQLHANEGEGLDFQTPPSAMTQAVFTAALTGATSHPQGTAILNFLHLDLNPGRVLNDHAICYPPTEPGAVLEPLYPDRLAEDFLALTLPGHTITAWPSEPWASSTVRALTARDANSLPPSHLARTFIILASAAAPGRWPHVTRHIEGLLRSDPTLAIAAGSAALSALADLDLDPTVLDDIESQFPEGRHVDLDPGIAAITSRLINNRLANTKDPAERARLHHALAKRLKFAGMPEEALAATEKALRIRKRLAEENLGQYGADYALMLNNRGAHLADMGYPNDSLAATREAIRIYRSLPSPDELGLARSLTNLSGHLSDREFLSEADAAAGEAVKLKEHLAAKDPIAYEPELLDSLLNLSNIRYKQGSSDEAIALTRRAVGIARRAYLRNPSTHAPTLARSLVGYSTDLAYSGKEQLALRAAKIAVQMARRVAAVNPIVHEPELASALSVFAAQSADLGKYETALAAINESVEIRERFSLSNPVLYEPKLARSLTVKGTTLFSLNRYESAERVFRDCLDIRYRLVSENPEVHDADIAESLYWLGRALSRLGRLEEAQRLLQDSADLYARVTDTNPRLPSHHADALAGLEYTMAQISNKSSPISRLVN